MLRGTLLLLLALLPAASCGGGAESNPGAGGGSATSAAGAGSSAWKVALVGTYERGLRVENNVAISSEGAGVEFKADGTYRVKTGTSWSSAAGSWSVGSTSITFTGGAASGASVALSDVGEGCRVLTFKGVTLFRDDVVTSCSKKPASLSSAECRLVGTWSRSTDDGAISTDESVTLEKDRFFLHESGRTWCTSNGTTTKCLRNSSRPAVGTWKVSSGKVTGAPDITGWSFEPGDGSCGSDGGRAGGAAGAGGGASSTLCAACSGANSCGAGERCGKRRCDAVAGCFATSGGSCAEIDGLSCPDVAIYGACTAASQCAASADCVGFDSRPARCFQTCATSADCVQPASAGSATMSCNASRSGERFCFVTCSGPGTCPSSMTCRAWSSGNFGYCD
ncbi:MAG: hypothetical protein JNJ54_20395 [Myxococcaceae bacterium]|nr:hypothetical protein [Myxococcaceae bacterium]